MAQPIWMLLFLNASLVDFIDIFLYFFISLLFTIALTVFAITLLLGSILVEIMLIKSPVYLNVMIIVSFWQGTSVWCIISAIINTIKYERGYE